MGVDGAPWLSRGSSEPKMSKKKSLRPVSVLPDNVSVA